MAIFEKLLLRKGIYEAPQGTFVATEERLRHFASQLAAMQRAGIRVPIAWGHQPAAEPGDSDDRARKQYYLSKHNAGYLLGLDYDAVHGRLKFRGDVPGAEIDADGNIVTDCTLPDGRKVKSAVGEVSAAVKDWKDGTGKIWKDVILHVALTPLPVVAGQDGFRALSAATNDGAGFDCFTLSLAHFHAELAATPTEPNMADNANAKTPPVDDKTPDGFAETIAGLKGLGVTLPPDTTPENFFQHARIAFHVLDNAPSDADGTPPEEIEGDPNPTDSGGQVVEEQRPVMMSAATEADPVRKLFLAKQQQQHKTALVRRIDNLAKKGLMPAHVAEGLRSQVDGYQLSLTAELDLVPRNIDRTLDVWEEAATHLKGAKAAGKVLLGTVGTEAHRPEAKEALPDKEIEALAASVSVHKSK